MDSQVIEKLLEICNGVISNFVREDQQRNDYCIFCGQNYGNFHEYYIKVRKEVPHSEGCIVNSSYIMIAYLEDKLQEAHEQERKYSEKRLEEVRTKLGSTIIAGDQES